MKKIISIVLCITLITFSFSKNLIFAEDTVYSEGALLYTINNGSITIVGYYGEDEVVHIPSMIAGKPVNSIARNAFGVNSSAVTVYWPETVINIEEGAFASNVNAIREDDSKNENNEDIDHTGLNSEDDKQNLENDRIDNNQDLDYQNYSHENQDSSSSSNNPYNNSYQTNDIKPSANDLNNSFYSDSKNNEACLVEGDVEEDTVFLDDEKDYDETKGNESSLITEKDQSFSASPILFIGIGVVVITLIVFITVKLNKKD